MLLDNFQIILIEPDPKLAAVFEEAFFEKMPDSKLIIISDYNVALSIILQNIGSGPFVVLSSFDSKEPTSYELLKKFRKEEKIKNQLVFVLSKHKSEENLIKAYELNVAGFIIKPTTKEQVDLVVEKLINYWSVISFPLFKK